MRIISQSVMVSSPKDLTRQSGAKLLKEEGFSSFRCFTLGCIITALAIAILPASFPASIVLGAFAFWYFFSATLIVYREKTSDLSSKNSLYKAAMEVNCKINQWLLFPLALFKNYHAPKGNLSGQPILLINGFLSSGSTWHYHRHYLNQAGCGPVYSMNIWSGGKIEDDAALVKNKVDQILSETGQTSISLVGHSKGGLVASYCALHLAADRIKSVVTIGSPLAGTKSAGFIPTEDCKQMRLGAAFNIQLRNCIKNHPTIKFYHIGSSCDQIVNIDSSLIGNNPERHFQVDDMGHASLVFSSRIANQVARWILHG